MLVAGTGTVNFTFIAVTASSEARAGGAPAHRSGYSANAPLAGGVWHPELTRFLHQRILCGLISRVAGGIILIDAAINLQNMHRPVVDDLLSTRQASLTADGLTDEILSQIKTLTTSFGRHIELAYHCLAMSTFVNNALPESN
ncbi:hypothetical protein EVAR_39280_1 [Eumeta japonica]|uniref:Uncharacterized protein n=1 Tax=Eumeta variegata TaxID=151549 RepID=A0A4C1VWQ6_EUMVA|nr:hypothetical protein EVAR_39280_1 [Eumeta japonica]